MAMTTIALAAFTAITVLSQLKEGADQKAEAKSQALQLEQQGRQEQAYAQRRAGVERHQANLAGSRALAVAASSGGGASDPDVENILGNIAGEGEMRAMSQIYEGDEKARGAGDQAGAARRTGQRAATASYWKAGATIASSAFSYGMAGAGGGAGSTMAEKYGGGLLTQDTGGNFLYNPPIK